MAVPLDLAAHASNLTHLFLTNKQPSESEIIDINHILTLAKDESTTLGKDDLLILGDLATKCKAAVSCVRRVPPELISEIFAMCVPDHVDDAKRWNTLDLTCVPWVLTRVSSLWRAIAISQPTLWAFIKIDLETTHLVWRLLTMLRQGQTKPFGPSLVMLETALERSGSIPLRVFFHDSFKPIDRAQEMLSSLMTHSHRWSQLSIYTSYAHLHLTNRVRGRLPLLRYLSIGAHGANTFPSFDGFEIAPMLQDVSIKLEDGWEALPLPWTQLTSLGGETTTSPAPTIGQSPELVRCHFHFPSGPLSVAPPVEHKKITHLTMDSIQFLNDLRLPSLQELIICNSSPSDQDLQTLGRFFRRFGDSLRVFTWKGVVINSIDPAQFQTILREIPNLVKLELGVKPSRSQQSLKTNIIMPLTILTIKPSWNVLPRLESITIKYNPFYKISYKPVIAPFLDMVESRWFKSRRGITQLREAQITNPSSSDEYSSLSKERIDALLEQGLLFSFVGGIGFR